MCWIFKVDLLFDIQKSSTGHCTGYCKLGQSMQLQLCSVKLALNDYAAKGPQYILYPPCALRHLVMFLCWLDVSPCVLITGS